MPKVMDYPMPIDAHLPVPERVPPWETPLLPKACGKRSGCHGAKFYVEPVVTRYGRHLNHWAWHCYACGWESPSFAWR